MELKNIDYVIHEYYYSYRALEPMVSNNSIRVLKKKVAASRALQ